MNADQFILYYAYKAGIGEFRNLFKTDVVDAYRPLHHTFQLVDIDGWIAARLFWLTEDDLLSNYRSNGSYDLMDTLKAVAFQYVKIVQSFPFKSKCS